MFQNHKNNYCDPQILQYLVIGTEAATGGVMWKKVDNS